MDHRAGLGEASLPDAELTAAAIHRRKEIWEALHPEKVVRVETVKPKTGGTSCPTSRLPDGRLKGPQHEAAFAAETSKLTSESKRDINRHIARAEALGPANGDKPRALLARRRWAVLRLLKRGFLLGTRRLAKLQRQTAGSAGGERLFRCGPRFLLHRHGLEVGFARLKI